MNRLNWKKTLFGKDDLIMVATSVHCTLGTEVIIILGQYHNKKQHGVHCAHYSWHTLYALVVYY